MTKRGRVIAWPRRVRDQATASAFLLPAGILLAIWFLVPIGQSLLLSTQEVDKFHFDERTFVGLSNFQQLRDDPAFARSVRITLAFVLLVVPAQTVLALLVAGVLQATGKGRTVFRTAVFVPYMTSTVAVTTIFMQLFVKGGPATSLLALFGLPDVTWYATVQLALVFLVLVYVYMYLGLYVVIFTGGMEGIPADLYEAARVDGAGAWARFRSITVPSLRPYLTFVVVVGLISAIQVFDQAYVIANGTILGSPAGATSTLVIFIYQQAFRLNAVGYASAAAVVLLAAVFAGTMLARRVVREAA